MPVKFIAEASSNHGQDLSRALAFVDAAADCGCDAVKLQLFRIAELFAPEILAKSAKRRARAKWELPNREWRADAADGLRLLRQVCVSGEQA